MSKKEGFFSIPRAAVDALVDNNANRKVIAGYLVLARFTDRKGVNSQAGASAMTRYLGMATGTAKAILKALTELQVNTDHINTDELWSDRLLVAPKDWGVEIQPKTQWIVNDYHVEADDRVWMPNTLVDGSDKNSLPLKRLIETGNDALMRAVLLLYAEHDEEQVAGVKPCATAYFPYATGTPAIIEELSVMKAEACGGMVYNATFASRVFGGTAPGKGALEGILQRLEKEGLIYRAVTVLDGDPSLPDSEILYTLDTKGAVSSATQERDDTLAHEIHRFAEPAGVRCLDAAGRFYSKYPVVVPAGRDVSVAEIIRLRYRITDPPEFLMEKLERVNEKHQEAREWVRGSGLPTDLSVDEAAKALLPPYFMDWAPEITFDDEPRGTMNIESLRDHMTALEKEKVAPSSPQPEDEIWF